MLVCLDSWMAGFVNWKNGWNKHFLSHIWPCMDIYSRVFRWLYG